MLDACNDLVEQSCYLLHINVRRMYGRHQTVKLLMLQARDLRIKMLLVSLQIPKCLLSQATSAKAIKDVIFNK